MAGKGHDTGQDAPTEATIKMRESMVGDAGKNEAEESPYFSREVFVY